MRNIFLKRIRAAIICVGIKIIYRRIYKGKNLFYKSKYLFLKMINYFEFKEKDTKCFFQKFFYFFYLKWYQWNILIRIEVLILI